MNSPEREQDSRVVSCGAQPLLISLPVHRLCFIPRLSSRVWEVTDLLLYLAFQSHSFSWTAAKLLLIFLQGSAVLERTEALKPTWLPENSLGHHSIWWGFFWRLKAKRGKWWTHGRHSEWWPLCCYGCCYSTWHVLSLVHRSVFLTLFMVEDELVCTLHKLTFYKQNKKKQQNTGSVHLFFLPHPVLGGKVVPQVKCIGTVLICLFVFTFL